MGKSESRLWVLKYTLYRPGGFFFLLFFSAETSSSAGAQTLAGASMKTASAISPFSPPVSHPWRRQVSSLTPRFFHQLQIYYSSLAYSTNSIQI